MEQPKPILNFSSVTPLIDIEFWLWFTKEKLDTWKLECPSVSITGILGSPPSKQVSSNLVISSPWINQSQTGGPMEFKIPGTFLHFNTIEEFTAFKFNSDLTTNPKVI